MIVAVEEAIVGMSPDESKTVIIPKEKAYGPYRKDMEIEIDRAKLPKQINPEVGQHLVCRQNDGTNLELWITHITQGRVTLDANHPLAGEDITLDIHLKEIM